LGEVGFRNRGAFASADSYYVGAVVTGDGIGKRAANGDRPGGEVGGEIGEVVVLQDVGDDDVEDLAVDGRGGEGFVGRREVFEDEPREARVENSGVEEGDAGIAVGEADDAVRALYLKGVENIEGADDVGDAQAGNGAADHEGEPDGFVLGEPAIGVAAGAVGRFTGESDVEGEDGVAGGGKLLGCGGGGGGEDDAAIGVGGLVEPGGNAAAWFGFEGEAPGVGALDLERAGLGLVTGKGADLRGEIGGYGRDGGETLNVERAGGFASDLPGLGGIEILFEFDGESGLRGGAGLVLKPLSHPGVNGGSSVGPHAVVAGGGEPGDLVFGSEAVVDALGFFEGPFGAGEGEEVLGGGADEVGLGSHGDEEVAVVEAVEELIRELLFGVLGSGGFELIFPGGDVAGGGGGFDAIIESGEIGGEGSAAGAAADADSGGVDLGERLEEIEASDAVPDHGAGDAFAAEERLDADHLMFDCCAADLGIVEVAIKEDAAFALAEGVVGEDDEAVFDEADGEALIELAGLGGEAVAGGLEDGRIGAITGFWGVEIGGDEEAGLAFEDDFFDAVIGVFDDAGALNVEGSALGREAADPLEEIGANLLRALADLIGGGELGDGFLAPGELALGDVLEPGIGILCGEHGEDEE